ncbi:MAG: sigma-54-dependent Fis family transcriptional regulator [Chelatococcus sp.]|uniref:sigma-54-dependent Fis family transcriptional regulator n=1 Tax=unclassified Chelatococcus TaxID=2638111 RepID=UPI001BCC50D6|nr:MULTISPECIES: sigma-54-dependent Fis family transcriptional regulator [unclassified Chelatococcus]CAH1657318.1 Acetoin catabolism regulatory protein [Hyphomicrobiales bacterium]MBS7742328.1 sigma-54-dependent Fis family transcriptional regulator [Chelatococcus sp. HY11]MBX3538365.1 sigma-54-dependent Fis family transcriptional regulator [Chelatococcus sp.]MBX3542554.1 sigma-54-dependent Fis family transcriptional regulator [Chelatococcus sp.]MCO5075229.1 sigma-54-dependent Fis family transc
MRYDQAAHIDELVRTANGQTTRRDAIIQDSWRRCVSEHNLDPEVLRAPCIVTQARLREHQEAMEEFLQTARFGAETLYRQVVGLGYVMLLTDSKGITVDFIGDPTFDNNLMRAGLYLGADWHEENAGTCAVGTCIATGEALVVHQTDHFDATHIPLTCTAAPVFDPAGNLAAVLDISALRSPSPKESQFLALQFVKSFAHKIETANLINRFRREWIIKLAASPEFADVEPAHVLAVDGSGRILGFNNMARELMRREDRAPDHGRPLVGRLISEFLDLAVDDLPRFAHSRPAAQRMVRLSASGVPFFAQTLPPPSRPVGLPANEAPQPALPKPLQALFQDEPGMHHVAVRAAKLVNTQMSLLICGETGSGKEYLAKAIHASSGRAGKPFIPVNCAALPETLIEGELFGYEPGAFTGAAAKGKKGLVIEADGGTLFLDEIGDMPLTLQTRLLRVLAEREVTPLGRSRPIPVNIRVIAATHRDLVAEVKAGCFREDLYFRLSGAILTLPSLRQRADLAWLVERLLAERVAQSGERFAIAHEAMVAMRSYGWPGNIRELANALDFACAVACDGIIRREDLPDIVHRIAEANSATRTQDIPHATTVPLGPAGGSPTASDRDQLIAVLIARQWNVSAVARDLGLDRTTVHRRMRRLGVMPPWRSTNALQ